MTWTRCADKMPRKNEALWVIINEGGSRGVRGDVWLETWATPDPTFMRMTQHGPEILANVTHWQYMRTPRLPETEAQDDGDSTAS